MKQNQKINEMFDYFNKYIDFLNNHYTIRECVKNERDKKINQDNIFNNVNAYYQRVNVKLSPKAPDDINKLKNILRDDVGSIMNPSNFNGGSTLINIKPKKKSNDGFRQCELKIYYAPNESVYDK